MECEYIKSFSYHHMHLIPRFQYIRQTFTSTLYLANSIMHMFILYIMSLNIIILVNINIKRQVHSIASMMVTSTKQVGKRPTTTINLPLHDKKGSETTHLKGQKHSPFFSIQPHSLSFSPFLPYSHKLNIHIFLSSSTN